MAWAKKSKVRASRGAGAAWAPKVAMATVEMMVEARIVRMRVEDGGELKNIGGRVEVGRVRAGEEKRQVGVEKALKRLAYIPVGLAGDALLISASDSRLCEQATYERRQTCFLPLQSPKDLAASEMMRLARTCRAAQGLQLRNNASLRSGATVSDQANG
jgi:hypothetical protein